MSDTIECSTPTNTLFAALEHVENAEVVIVIIQQPDPENKEFCITKTFTSSDITYKDILWFVENYKRRLLEG